MTMRRHSMEGKGKDARPLLKKNQQQQQILESLDRVKSMEDGLADGIVINFPSPDGGVKKKNVLFCENEMEKDERGRSPCPSIQLSPSASVENLSPAFDPWQFRQLSVPEQPSWKELSACRKCAVVVGYMARFAALLCLLYVFICSLDMLSSAFRLLGGRTAGRVFRESELLSNPVAGLMIGVLATVLLQSSSTSTSIVVSMVASDIVPVRAAIPIVMGANIGTSMTNTLVSAAHANNRAEFRRAFAGATVHDMFNWMCVLILLPLEICTGYLYYATLELVKLLKMHGGKGKKMPKLLQVLTKPLTSRIVELDKSKLKDMVLQKDHNIGDDGDFTLVKRFCGHQTVNMSVIANVTSETINSDQPPIQRCGSLFAHVDLDDSALGAILLVVALALLITCLLGIVKVLQSMLQGQISSVVHRTINNDLPKPFAFLTGYVTIIVGALMTILVQSSSVFTSALTPLVGIGVLELDRMYPLTLGANVGTTFTSVLAALASPPSKLASALQISLCHLFFNLTGILLFYVIPCSRRIPIGLAEILGTKTAKYRWVAIAYIAIMFFLLPGAVFALSLAGPNVLLYVGSPILIFFLVVVIINVIQVHKSHWLPKKLRTWNWLPLWLHSLAPLDALFVNIWNAIQSACPFCASGWPCCYSNAPTASVYQGEPPSASASCKHLISLNSSPLGSANASRVASRSSSPKPSRPDNNRFTALFDDNFNEINTSRGPIFTEL